MVVDTLPKALVQMVGADPGRVAMRRKELERVMAFVNLIGNISKGIPEVVKMVKLQKLLGMAVQALNWDEKEILEMPEHPMPPPGFAPAPAPAGGGAGAAPPGIDMSAALGAPQPGNASAGMAGSPGSASSVLMGE